MNNKHTVFRVVESLQKSLFGHLEIESDRGFVLMATAYVDDQMTELFKGILPEDLKSNNKTKKIFGYPGCLENLAAKSELAYICRLIDKQTYDAIMILRKIRNRLAHTNEKFSLEDSQDLERLYELFSVTDEYVQDIINLMKNEYDKWSQSYDKILEDSIREHLQSPEIQERFIVFKEEYKKEYANKKISDEEIYNIFIESITSGFTLGFRQGADRVHKEYNINLSLFKHESIHKSLFWKLKVYECVLLMCINIKTFTDAVSNLYEKEADILSIYSKMLENNLLD